MRATTADDRRDLSRELLGSCGSFSAYFQNYDDFATKDNTFDVRDSPTPRNHQDIIYATRLLRDNPKITKEEAIKHLQESWNTFSDIESILALAVQAMTMIDSAAQSWYPPGFSLGEYRPISWLSQEPFVSFIERSFPKIFNRTPKRVYETVTDRAQLKAWKLQKRVGIALRPTDNISEHLLLDIKNNTLYLFHHAAYLKAHLARFQDVPQAMEVKTKDSLERGSLPPQLLVETLHSLQGILFSSLDEKSGEILNTLIRKDGFDPECAQYEGYKIFSEPPEGFNYVYWGERIAKLSELVGSRPPRNSFEKWFQQWTTERNALLIALLALFISVFVGVLSIVLGCVQVWIAWMAWKHPVHET